MDIPTTAPDDSDNRKAVWRIVAIKMSRSIAAAAARLGMASVSLTRWLDRREKLLEGDTIYIPRPGCA